MTQALNFKIVAHNSPEYWDIIELRDAILRKPLGMVFTKEELLAEGSQIHVGAWLKGQLVACLALVPLSKEELKMRQVAVSELIQGKGIGKQLSSFCEAYARDEGYKFISLHAREVASKFYLKQNYRIVGEPFEEVGLPHYRMEKVL